MLDYLSRETWASFKAPPLVLLPDRRYVTLFNKIGSLRTPDETAGVNENTAFNATGATQFFVTESPPFFW